MTDNSAQKTTLQATVRDTFGKSIRMMRRNGSIPANIYGTNFKSQAITVDAITFNAVYKEAGETGVIYVEADGKSYPTLVTDIQYDPVKGNFIHVDFRKVDLKKKIEAQVPLKVFGESIAVEQKNGVLLTQMDEITVEALPADIPHEIEIDISVLQEIGDEIKVSQLPTSDKYVIIEEPERVIVSVTEHKEESIEPETVTEAPEITSEKIEDGVEATAEAAGTESEESK